MDPNATLELIFDLLATSMDGYDETIEAIESLVDWLDKGGFKPDHADFDSDWFDICEAVHWHCVDCHSRQSSDLYRLQCKIGYTPAIGQCGPSSSQAEGYYDTLCVMQQMADTPTPFTYDTYKEGPI